MPIIQTNSGYGYVYQKSGKRQKRLSPFVRFFLTMLVIVSVTFGGIYLARIIPNYLGIRTNYYFNKTNIYSICCGSFDDFETASVLAKTIKNQGGAGYIFFANKKYNVLLSGYEKKEECLVVIDNLSQNGVETNLLCITLDGINANFSASNEDKVQIKKAIHLFFDCYKSLYSLSVDFDKDIMSKGEIIDSVKKLSEEVKKQKNAFTTNIHETTNASLVYLKIYLDKLNDCLLSLMSCQENFSAEIKNTYLQALMCYKDFRQEIN